MCLFRATYNESSVGGGGDLLDHFEITRSRNRGKLVFYNVRVGMKWPQNRSMRTMFLCSWPVIATVDKTSIKIAEALFPDDVTFHIISRFSSIILHSTHIHSWGRRFVKIFQWSAFLSLTKGPKWPNTLISFRIISLVCVLSRWKNPAGSSQVSPHKIAPTWKNSLSIELRQTDYVSSFSSKSFLQSFNDWLTLALVHTD